MDDGEELSDVSRFLSGVWGRGCKHFLSRRTEIAMRKATLVLLIKMMMVVTVRMEMMMVVQMV